MAAGYSEAEINQASIGQINRGCDIESLKEARKAGVSIKSLKEKGCGAASLRAAGYSAAELKSAESFSQKS